MEAAHESNASAGLYVHGIAISPPPPPHVSRMCVCVFGCGCGLFSVVSYLFIVFIRLPYLCTTFPSDRPSFSLISDGHFSDLQAGGYLP